MALQSKTKSGYEYIHYQANKLEVREMKFVAVKMYTRVYDNLGYLPSTKKKLVRLYNRKRRITIASRFPLNIFDPNKMTFCTTGMTLEEENELYRKNRIPIPKFNQDVLEKAKNP